MYLKKAKEMVPSQRAKAKEGPKSKTYFNDSYRAGKKVD